MIESANRNYPLLAVVVHFTNIQQSVILHFELAFHIYFYNRFADGTCNGIANAFQNSGIFIVFLIDSDNNVPIKIAKIANTIMVLVSFFIF